MSGTIKTEILTTDGVPLKDSLKKAERKNKIRATLLVLPLLLFIFFTFIVPIGSMLTRSTDDSYINKVFPNTFKVYQKWDRQGLPPEEVYAAMFLEVKNASGFEIGKASTRMNYAKSGWKSMIKKSKRKFKKIDVNDGPFKDKMIEIDKKWADKEYWLALGVMVDPTTYEYYFNAIDKKYDSEKNVIDQPENRQIYVKTWIKTFKVSILVTFFCLMLGYPIAYLLATLPLKYSNLLMICVLLPFWTSLLVRIVVWMVILQQKGVFNNLMVISGLIADENRWQLMYNQTGTIIVMTQILLPFMVLPLYSVMKTISPSLVRAGKSLGGTPFITFWKVYFPLTIPGIGAGSLLVFILAIGYYITPELVGGASGTLISNQIAYHMKYTLDWSFASAMGLMLLVGVLAVYWVYNKLVGIDNIKLG